MSKIQSRRSFLTKTGQGLLGSSILGAVGASGVALCSGAKDGTTDNFTPYLFGALGDGRGDDTVALQRAVTAAIQQDRTLDLSHGTFKVTSSIVGQGKIRIVNSGRAVIDAAPGNYQKYGVIVLEGSAKQVGRLIRSSRRGETRLRVSTPETFEVGDVGIIYNSANFSYSGFRPYYRAGEFFEVGNILDDEVVLERPLFDDYDADFVDISSIEPIRGYVKDIIINSQGSPESLLVVDYSRGFEVINPVMTHANNDCIVVSRSVDCTVRNPTLTNSGDGGDDYGLVWSNSQHCRMIGGKIYARRHAVAIGGADQLNGVPCRDITVQGATLRNDPSTVVHCADIHGNSEQCGYDQCLIFGGFSPQGRASFLRNSTVHAMSIGTAVYGAELLGGVHAIKGNTFHIAADPSISSRGAIDFGGNSDAITASTVSDLTILFENNEIISSALGTGTVLLYVRNAGSTNKINVRFSKNKIRVNDFVSAVRMRLDKGIAKSDFIDVDCAQTGLIGKYALHPDKGYSDLSSAPSTQEPSCGSA